MNLIINYINIVYLSSIQPIIMGIYTDSHGNTYSINIADPELQMISNNPDFHFCWMNENENIRDKNSDYYEDDSTNNLLNEDKKENNEDKKENNEDEKENNNTRRMLKEKITVMTTARETVTGRVWHWVHGPCAGTDLQNWFIICTKPYPYIRNRKQAWN